MKLPSALPFALSVSCAAALALGPGAARAADVSYSVYVDGRPLDASTPSGLQHRGVAYVNVVRAVKTFDGLLTFAPGGVVRVSIGGQTLDFRDGRRSVRSGASRRRLPGAPFVENGITYVPLATIAALASAKLALDPVNHRYLLTSAPQRTVPAAQPSAAQTSDELVPSAAQAVAIATFARSDRTGLHVRAELVNRTNRTYALDFPTSQQIEFIVARNGTEVWNSVASEPADPHATTLVLGPHASRSARADWSDFAAAGPGRYTLRVRVLTATPLDQTPISLAGV